MRFSRESGESRGLASRGSGGRYAGLGTEDSSSDSDSSGCKRQEAPRLRRAEKRAIEEGDRGDRFNELLEVTCDGLSWPRQCREHVLEEVALKGHLVPWLETFEMPLFMYVDFARTYFSMAWERFNSNDETEAKAEFCRVDRGFLRTPTPSARLLSNYLIVPTVKAHEWLKTSEKQMVVFKGSKDDTLKSIEYGFRGFPEWFGALYLTPRVDWKGEDMVYHPKDGYGRLTVKRSRAFGTSGELKELNLPATSLFDFPEAKIIEHQISHGIAPESTKKFAYVYPHEGFPAGGFLYLGLADKCLAVSQVTTNVSSHALRMGQRTWDDMDLAHQCNADLKPQATTLDALRQKGARQFCYFGPGRFADEGLGGFAYWFEDASMNSYFPVHSFAHVRQHAPSAAVGNAALFPKDPDSHDVGEALMKQNGFPFFNSPVRDGCVTMKVCRLMQKGLTHPVVLRSLVLMPKTNDDVLESHHVQAIVTAAFQTCYTQTIWEMLTIICMMLPIFQFTDSYRHGRSTALSTAFWAWPEWVLFGVLLSGWIATVYKILICIVGFRSFFGGLEQLVAFLGSSRLVVWWVQCAAVLCLIVMLLRGPLLHYPRLAAPAFAASGTICWIQLLYLARSFEFVGKRFLPIISAWQDATSFLLVTSVVMAAVVQASYALTTLPLTAILVDTYRMGFLGDLKPRLFVSEPFDLDEHPDAVTSLDAPDGFRTSFAYLSMMAFGFILMVSMANVFIQVMGDAYTSSKERVYATLTRARAEESLICSLRKVGRDVLLPRWAGPGDPYGKFVWFAQEEEGPPSAARDEAVHAAVAAAAAKAAVEAAELLGGCGDAGELHGAVERAVRRGAL
ncbi:unnamed protein product [Prorocentrum cordatum]|uniref:Ion transport domain-containing protein n=1 Tax=Prorocentrum cordatum TaxID=2364126 RepID=A0ABN9X2M2_9DINO|nr:unnamed protein product [Polarella glacialis]